MTLTKWSIDPTHSEVQFKIKHLVITTVTGHFFNFSGDVEASENFDAINTNFEADINSISTNNEGRDGHLKSEEFFDVEKHPKLIFKSKGLKKTGEGEFNLSGDLTLKGITKNITLSVSYEGTATDPWGNVKAGFELNGKINRNDYGLNWSAVTEAGGLVVSDEVKIHANIQLVKQV